MASSISSSVSALQWGSRADDLHHHLRDGDALKLTVAHVAQNIARCVVMPNLVPPVTTTEQALAYRERILVHVPQDKVTSFQPLMTLYMTDHTSAEEIQRAAATGKIVAVKLYPAGATTNSDAGVTNMENIYPALEAMSAVGMPLLVHGEVTDQSVDIFDREACFIEQVLKPLVARFPQLKVVMEHITTADAAKFVTEAPANVAATITPQHLLYNRNGEHSTISCPLHLHSLPRTNYSLCSDLPGRSASAQVLSAGAQARDPSPGASSGRGQRKPQVLPWNGQCTARGVAQGVVLRLRRHLLGPRGTGAVRRGI